MVKEDRFVVKIESALVVSEYARSQNWAFWVKVADDGIRLSKLSYV